MNSVIQALVHLSPMVDYFTRISLVKRHGLLISKHVLSSIFSGVISEMSSNRVAQLKQQMSTKNPVFRGNLQQDAQEFLISLLDGLDEELKNEPNNIIKHLFQGQLCSTVKCNTCQTESRKIEPILHLSISIPIQSNGISLHDCLKSEFLKIEKILPFNKIPQDNKTKPKN